MRILFVNSVCGIGSTGRIVSEIYDLLVSQGNCAKVAFGCGEAAFVPEKDQIRINSKPGYYVHDLLARITDRAGFFSRRSTEQLIRQIELFHPNLIHLHNLHGFYINVELLFMYLGKLNIPIVWTLHDCWAITGHCAHFDYVQCDKWMTGCGDCPGLHNYPKSFFVDQSKRNFMDKKALYASMPNMTLVTPSKWLERIVVNSFLSDMPVVNIPNGIDLNCFHPIASTFRNSYGLESKYIILGVAFSWSKKKGLDVFISMAEHLDSRFQIVLIGTTKEIERELPPNIISIHRTNSQKDLVEIYSAADVFANPTREDNFPTVNIEALACGTPVVTFQTGGSPEIIDETCGLVIPRDNVGQMISACKWICEKKPFPSESCRERASLFSKDISYGRYIELYKELTNEQTSI